MIWTKFKIHKVSQLKVRKAMNLYSSIKSIFTLFYILIKNVWLILTVLIFLSITSVFLLQKVSFLSAQLVSASATLNAQKMKHKADLKKAISKEKAKSRIKQTLIAIPFIGSAVFATVELNDFRSWQRENPDKTKIDYACENANASIEVLNELMNDLPSFARKNVRASMKTFTENCEKYFE